MTKATAPTDKPTNATPRVSKLDLLSGLLKASDGATMKQMMDATGWQPHSVRGAMAGALRKRGLNIASNCIDGVRRWSLSQEGAAR